MAIGVAGILAFFGMVSGTLGVLLFGVLGIMLTFFLFGAAIIALEGDADARITALRGKPPRGWSPTCPGCGLDIVGNATVCPHCGRALAPATP